MPLGPTEWIVIGVVIALLIFGFFRGRKRAQEADQRLESIRQEAESRGWQFEGGRKGREIALSFSGTTGGLAWHLETRHDPQPANDVHSSEFTYWRSDSVTLPGEVVLLVPRQRNTVQLGALSVGGDNPLAQVAQRAFLKNVLHVNPADVGAFDRVQSVETGSEALRDRYMVMATGEIASGRFLNPQAETALLAYSEGDDYHVEARIGAVLFWEKGLTIGFTRAVLNPDEIEEIGRFGAAIAGRSEN